MQTEPYPVVDLDFGHWLAGFIDGEGCFLITCDRRQWRRDYYFCHFRLCLRSDDTPLLVECQQRTGLGKVYPRPERGNDGHDRKPQVRWEVFTKGGCGRLVEVLSDFPLRSKKRRDFEIWAEAVRLRALITQYGPRHGRHDEIWTRLAGLKRAIEDVRQWREHESILIPEPFEDDPVPACHDLPLF